MEAAIKICFNSIVSEAKRPLLVGVVGDSGSGKSYAMSLLIRLFEKTNLHFSTLNHDEFLISRADREPMKSIIYTDGPFSGKSHWEILENMFRMNDFRRVITQLKNEHSSEFYPYSRALGEVLPDPREVEASDFILCDTSMLINEMDFVIFVDVTQENIISRKLIRDSDARSPEEIIDMHTRVQGYYWTNRGIPKHPNIVIDNNDHNHVITTVM